MEIPAPFRLRPSGTYSPRGAFHVALILAVVRAVGGRLAEERARPATGSAPGWRRCWWWSREAAVDDDGIDQGASERGRATKVRGFLTRSHELRVVRVAGLHAADLNEAGGDQGDGCRRRRSRGASSALAVCWGAAPVLWGREDTGGALHCQGRQRPWAQRVPCRVLDHALPDRVLAEADPHQRATLVAGLARTSLAAACPAYDPAAVLAAADAAASQGAVEDEVDDRARFERLLGDLRLE